MDITVGAWGWKHTEWEEGRFYPDDLPSDWRLSYYSNEFDLVVVPASYWSAEDLDEEDWHDDVGDDFMFYLDWPLEQSPGSKPYQKCVAFCQQLGDQLAGILINNENWPVLSDADKNALFELTQRYTVRQYGKGRDIDTLEWVADDLRPSGAEAVQSLLLHSDMDESLRELGQRLKQLLTSAPIKHIILTAKSPSIDRLKELKTLVELLVG